MVWKSLGWGETFTRALCRGFVNKDMPWRALCRGALFTSFVLLISIAAVLIGIAAVLISIAAVLISIAAVLIGISAFAHCGH